MTPLGPPTPPPARSLAQWWTDLASRQPHRLWFAAWACHRLEARVEVACVANLDPLSLALLRQLGRGPFPPSALETLHLDSAWLHALLRQLLDLGLVQQTTGWEATAAGRKSAASGQVSHRCRKRRVFYFVDRSEEQRPPHYLSLTPGKPVWGTAPPGWQLPAGCLEECIGQTPEWKQRFQFPTEVLAVIPPEGSNDWEGVRVDFPEPVLLALVEVGAGTERAWLGFRIQAGSWQLLGTEPVLRLGPGWEEVFPILDQDPPLEAWRQEWLRWCQPHNLPAAEVEACVLQRQGHRLVVQAPRRMIERYRSGPRAEALQKEGWLLAGEGRCRAAGQIELVEGP